MQTSVEAETAVKELDVQNSPIAAARLVRNWNARCPDMFAGVDRSRLISFLAEVHQRGGVNALVQETGLYRAAVIYFLRCAP